YRLPDIIRDDTTQNFTSFGGFRSSVRLIGEFSTIDTFTIGSASGLQLTASVNPGWTVNEHRGRFIYARLFGFADYYFPIISNTADTLTLNAGDPDICGFYPLPNAGAEVNILQPASRILPPLTNSTNFINRFWIHGKTQ